MDELDKKILNQLQIGLPIECDPYRKIAVKLGVKSEELLERIKQLSDEGYIRRLGGIFDVNKMGYKPTLVGLHVPEDIFMEVANYVNKCKGVTHNYRRGNYLNMWFTLALSTQKEKDEYIEKLKNKFQLKDVMEFPTLKYFKLRVFFDMESEMNYGSSI
ncbi:AsnC family transcriptional regulator [Alkalibaculum sp. M08DMB]|uniref:siroheme decarboxylase n=1 Tax=Alkalibaculum sporogenes TaxID=2655001 RepID=A0A6A7K6N6_9FIRM|nr:AsnC family transcriptional regulator [Alkalibaculum sporogenes]MPW25096.1 AsnC family transcriptional regulator [Alkalibaculum sporogenes]